MGNYSKSIVLSMVLFFGCQSEPEPLPTTKAELSELEALLTGTWTYRQIDIVGSSASFVWADAVMELGFDYNAMGGNRADLFRRNIHYSVDGTYQLRWTERGDYTLGTEGDPNWQPNFGYWELDGDSLIHNRGAWYEQRYFVTLSDSVLTRRHARYMSKGNADEGGYLGAFWRPGEYLDQIEIFTTKD